MSWLLIIVVIIFLVAIIRGWARGCLRILFSLVCIIVLIFLISWLSPYISTFLTDYTGAYDAIEARCASAIENQVGTGLAFLTNSTAEMAATWILKGLSFLITLIVAAIIIWIIFRVIGLVDRIPVIRGVNRVLGLFAGGIQGYIVVCLLMLFISFIGGSQMGQTLTETIDNNGILSFLYYHNILLNLNLFK